MFYYKETALGFSRLFVFFQCGIPHRSCRFYCCLAAHQRTKEKDSAEPLSSILWTPPPHPGGIRCGGAYLLPRVWDNIGSCIPVQVDNRQFGIWFCFLCSGYDRSRFSWVVGLWSHVFHYWGDGRSCLRLRGGLLWSFVGFALTAVGSFVLADTVMEYQIISSLSCTNAFLQ